MRNLFYAVIWTLVYLLIILAPIIVLMFDTGRMGREVWREFSVALGFAGLSMMGLQFLITARIRPIVRNYGIDIVYHFHRQISIVAFLLILAHPIILFIGNPENLSLLNPFTAPLRAVFGLSSILLLALLIVLSIKRLDLKLKYEPWRLTHGFLAALVLIFAMLHVLGVGYYINTPGKQVLWVTLSVLWIGALGYVRILKPLLMLRKPYIIEEVRPEKGNAHTIVFKPVGHKGIAFRPGQFAWMTIWTSPYNIREHPFSFSSSAMKTDRLEFTIKELGDFTSQVKTIQPGTRAYLDGPYGIFSVDFHPADGYVFIAGGAGITPIMSTLRTLADRRDARPVTLFYGSRTWEDLTFREDIETLKQQINLTVIYVLEKPMDGWAGPTGFITADLLAKHFPENRRETYYFLCGPAPMMVAIGSALDRLGIMPEKIVTEDFALV